MAIQIADGFQLRVAKPLDDRQNVETVAQLDPTYGYEGQIVYVKDIKQFYTCYKDGNGSLSYKVMETGNAGGGDLTDYQEKTDNTLTTTDKTIVGAINELKKGVSSISVPTKVSQLTNDSGYITSDEVDLKANDSEVVKKTDIVTTIDSSSTDEQVPSAKAVYDGLENINDFSVQVVKNSLNLNNITETGIYFFSRTYTPVNTPTGVNGWLLVMKGSYSDIVKQVWYSIDTADSNSYNTFERYNGGEGWTEWTKFLTETDVNLDNYFTKAEIEAMTDLILDTEVRTDKTYSSSKIYADIQQCLEDSKTYTLKELGKFGGVSYKIVSSTSEMTSESIIYLLENGNTYDMYIVEENGATTKIGDTNVNLSDYYTKTEVDNDFLKKVDADGKYATITTVDGKVDKDKIVTTLNDSVTDKQVASALLIKTELDKTNAKLGEKADNTELDKRREIRVGEIYNSDGYHRVDAIGYYGRPLYFRVVSTTGGEEILSFGQIVTSERRIIGKSVNATFKYIPPKENASNGTLFIKTNRVDPSLTIFYTQIYSEPSIPTLGYATAEEYATGMDFNVLELATMDKVTGIPNSDLTDINTKLSQLENTVNQIVKKDIPKTILTPDFPGEVRVASGGAAITYIVKNGWCSVNFAFNIASATTVSWTNIATGLPKPANNVNIVLINDEGKINRTVPIKINSDGSVSSRVPYEISAVDWWSGNVSYPVAE